MRRIERLFQDGGILQTSLPNYEYRHEQVIMADAVYQAITRKQPLIVEAGCGVGKSFAYLVPVTQMRGLRAIVSTATRALQEQLYYKDIPIIQQYIRKGFRAVYIKGRSNYVCKYRLEHSRQHSLFDSDEYVQQLVEIERWSQKTRTGDVIELDGIREYAESWKAVCCTAEGCLGYLCPYYQECFLVRLKKEARAAHLIIVNHHLFFADIMLRNEFERSILPSYHIVIFDEAHLLEEIATLFLGYSLGTTDFRRYIYRYRSCVREFFHTAHHLKTELLSYVDVLHDLVDAFFQTFSEKRGKYSIEHLDSDSYKIHGIELIKHSNMIITSLRKHEKRSEECVILAHELQKYTEQVKFFLESTDTNYVHWYEIGTKNRVIHSSPINVSALFQEGILQRCSRVVLTSATLSVNGSFEYIQHRLGFQNAQTVFIDSPYNFKDHVILYVPTHICSPKSANFAKEFADIVYQTLIKTEGRAFVLFTSYRNMETVYNIVNTYHLPYRLLRQGEVSRTQLIEQFQSDIHSVLFATSTYWQGIDVPGEALSCVIIDKLPFAVPSDPVSYHRMLDVVKQGKNAFRDYQVPQAVLDLRQGVGRLIRRSSDTGVIVIGDKRLETERYGVVFKNSLPQYTQVHNIDDIYVPKG